MVLLEAFLRAKEGLIRHLAQKAIAAEKTTEDLDDLLQAARLGFLRALDDWDPDKGALSTHAGWWIKNRIQRAAHDAQTIALPRIRATTEERNRAVLALRDDPDVDAASLGLTPGVLEQVKKSVGLRYASVDMFGDGDDAPRRQRQIERRISEGADPVDAEADLDTRSLVRCAIDAVRELASQAELSVEDALAGLSRTLGCSPDPVNRPAQKATARCPTPPSTPPRRLTLKPLTRPSLAGRAARARGADESPLRSLLLRGARSLRPRLSVRSLTPSRPISRHALPWPMPTNVCRPSFGRSSSSASASPLRKAA